MKTITFLAFLIVFACSAYTLQSQARRDEIGKILDLQEVKNELRKAKKVVFRNTDSAHMVLNHLQPLIGDFDDQTMALYHNTYGLYYWFVKDYDASIASFHQTLKLPMSDSLTEYRAEALNNAGTLYSKIGQQDSAINLLTQALKIDEDRKNEIGMAKIHYDLGLAHQRKGHYELALRNMLKSLDLNEKNKVSTSRVIANHNVLGNLYSHLNDTAASAESFNKALNLAISEKDSNLITMIYGNLAVMYQLHGKNDLYFYYAQKSKHYLPADCDPQQLGVVYFNLAGAFSELSRYDSAIHYFNRGKPLINDLRIGNQAEALVQMAYTYLKINRIDSARAAVKNSLTIAKAIQSPTLIAEAYAMLSDIDSASLDFRSAYRNYKRSRSLFDSIHNKDHMQRIAELRIIYDSDKKEAENSLLKSQNSLKGEMIRMQRLALFAFATLAAILLILLYKLKQSNKKIAGQQEIILRKNDELQELNQTKDKFISIIAHDLRSPFNSLLGLLQDLLDHYDNYTDEEKVYLLESTFRSSTNTYNLLVNLLDWTIAQRNGFENKPGKVYIAATVESVFQILSSRAMQKKIVLINAVDAAHTAYVDPNILANVLINLVNNAIKFTPLSGQIKVKASFSHENEVTICVEDNGIGIPAEKLDKLFDLDSDFKRKGTADELGTGLGLVLVKEFVKASKGSLNVKSTENEGSVFCVTLPADKF